MRHVLIPTLVCSPSLSRVGSSLFLSSSVPYSFLGSGITVFVYQAGPVGINASMSIDGAHAQTNVLSAPPAPSYEIANVSMFDVQQLPSGTHTLSLLINDLSGSYSGMMFDYAYINESLVTDTTTTTPTTATSTAVPSSSPPSPSSASQYVDHSSIITPGPLITVFSTDISAIVGGVIGGIALLVAGVLAFLWIRRRRGHPPEMIDLCSDSASPPPHSAYLSTGTAETCDPYSGYDPPTNGGLTPSRSTEFSPLIALAPSRLGSSAVQHAPNVPSAGQDILIPFMTSPTTSDSSGTLGKPRPELSNDAANAPSPSSSRQDTSPLLTDEQADFINSLHRNNVPAAAIARVVERMLVDQHAGIREWERETRLAQTNTMTTAPPSYDLVAERGEW